MNNITKKGVFSFLIVLSLLILSTAVFAAQNESTTSNVFILNSDPVVRAITSTDPAEVGVTTITVTVNVTDPNGVPNDIGTVILELDNGTASTADDYSIAMSYNGGSGLYENDTFQIPAHSQIGTWGINITATDDFAAVDYNESSFIVQDTVIPAVTNPQPPEASNYAQSAAVTLSVDVLDDGTLDIVRADVVWPGAGSESVTLTDGNGDDTWDNTFSSTATVGRYNVTFYVNDTGSPTNVNNTITTYFLVGDSVFPTVENYSATPSPVDPGNTINFTVDVSDNIGISQVLFEIDGTNYSGVQNGGNEWYYDQYDTYVAPAVYNVRIYANDTTNNINGTTTGTFTVNTLVSVALQNVPIDFGNATVGDTDRRAENGTTVGGSYAGTLEGFPLVVNVTGNVNLNMSINGTDLVGQSDGGYSIANSDVKYDTDSGVAGASTLSGTLTGFANNIAYTSTQDLYFWITIPSGLPRQAYQGTVLITTEQS